MEEESCSDIEDSDTEKEIIVDDEELSPVQTGKCKNGEQNFEVTIVNFRNLEQSFHPHLC
jgi:hypothetical protein